MTIESLSIAALRSLAIDATNYAKSGHPGMPIGSAPAVYTLFTKHLVSHPRDPNWINRDRFILSAGHASMLLYGILHLAGYDLPLDQIKKFRQLGSLTPGHPEVHLTPGVDATTGPLGQGLAQAVGVALAERTLRAMYAQEGLIDHYTYVLTGDGCLQEGVSQEAISFAGHQQLHKLIAIYDANDVTLDGPLSASFSEDVKKRFIASGWQVLTVEDGNDLILIDKAIRKAKRSKVKPTLIMMKTIIGQGSKNQGTYKVHGNPLGQEDGLTTKQSYGWTFPDFHVPQEVYDHFATTLQRRGKNRYRSWTKQLRQLETSNPSRYQQFIRGDKLDFTSPLPANFITFAPDYKDATRNSSQAIINAISQHDPLFVGGSADVAKSVMTTINQGGEMSAVSPLGKNISFGIREFGMASIQNGMMLHRGLRTFTGTFLAFADYMKPAIRLAALSHIPSIFVFSHDSVALGEDGPTHQPIDQLAMLRSIPHIQVFRPGDAKETLAAWLAALGSQDRPTVIVLTRQAVPLLPPTDVQQTLQGAYVLIDQPSTWTLVATGSETSLAYQVVQTLQSQHNIGLRLVSMPCVELFKAQTQAVRDTILGQPWQRVITLEALSTFGWAHVGQHNFGIDTFGQSAPGNIVMTHFGMTVPAIVEKILALVASA